MFKTILWATDGSASADRALPYVKDLAAAVDGGKLVAVHCREIFVGGRGGGYPVLADDDELLAKIEQQVEDLRTEGVDASFEVITTGAPGAAHAIADAAREREADVIVVGTRGHGPMAGLLVGSITQRLLHIAPCPVLSVPTGKYAKLDEHELEATGVAR